MIHYFSLTVFCIHFNCLTVIIFLVLLQLFIKLFQVFIFKRYIVPILLIKTVTILAISFSIFFLLTLCFPGDNPFQLNKVVYFFLT